MILNCDDHRLDVYKRQAYQLACGFLEEDVAADANRVLEMYLCGYEEGKNPNSYTFYFNYRFNDLPFLMDAQRMRDWKMKAPVEIYVEGSKVRRYKRYVVKKEMTPYHMMELQESYIEAMDLFFENYPDLTGQNLTEFTPVYQQSGGEIELTWMAEVHNAQYYGWSSQEAGG